MNTYYVVTIETPSGRPLPPELLALWIDAGHVRAFSDTLTRCDVMAIPAVPPPAVAAS